MGKSKESRVCDDCGTIFNSENSMKNGSFFLHMPLKEQLEQLLTNPELYSYLSNRNLQDLIQSTVISDVTTGKLYQNLIKHHGMSKNDLSLTWNGDGIPVFKSSQYSIWPIQCMINELPPHLRPSNILLTGLWFGKIKPKMNTFLVPFVSECKELEEEGFIFQGESMRRKVFAVINSSDTPARAIMRNCKQFNGKCGCDWCEHEGVTISKNGGPPTRYYPQRGDQRQRTSKGQAEHATKAEILQEPVKGVKGVSVIDILPTFDTVNGFTPEYMHSVCQGVLRQLCNLWLDSGNHEEDFYLGRKLDKLDERLLLISPPSEFTRAPRSIKDRKFWKASEWRAFMLYSLAVLQGLLPRMYLQHFFLLVYGVYTLLGDNITNDMLFHANTCLVKFVTDMEGLYGLSSCTFNVHILTHLADGVKWCGPLWAHSAFVFEANNHVLLKMFSGTQYVPQQICDTFLLSQKLLAIENECIKEDTSPRVRFVLQKMIKSNLVKKNERILERNISGLGVGKPIFLTASQTISLGLLIGRDVLNRSAIIYDRFIINHVLYTGRGYTRSTRHHDFMVKFHHHTSQYGIILGLYVTKPDCQCTDEELQACQCPVYNVVIVKVLKCESGSLFTECGVSSHFLKEYTEDYSTVSIYPEKLQAKCIAMKVRNRHFLCEVPCKFYGD